MKKITKETLAKEVGERLKELRKASKKSRKRLLQDDVAADLGITKQALSSYESGRHLPDHTVLISLAEYYSCTTDYLYGFTDKKMQSTPIYSKRESVNQLLHALDTVTEDEGDFYLEKVADLLNSLSLTSGNPKRNDFFECFVELFTVLAEYVAVSAESSKRLSQASATKQDVAKAAALFYGYDELSKIVEKIRRTGFATVMFFSTEAKKVLRTKKDWYSPDNENNPTSEEIAHRFTEMIEKEDRKNGEETRSK